MIKHRLSQYAIAYTRSFGWSFHMAVVSCFCLAVLASPPTQAQTESPVMKFSVRGAAELRSRSGRIEKVEFSGFSAPKDIGEEIAKEPDLSCQEATGEGSAPTVTLTVSKIPSFDLRGGSAYNCVISKAKKQGVTFKIKTEVGGTGVTG